MKGDIVAELQTYLKTITAVTDLVGAGVAARMYDHLAKQGVALPFVVFEVFEGSSAECIDSIAGVAMARIQVDCYGSNADQAWQLHETIRLAPLQMFRGYMGETFVHNVSSEANYLRGWDPATTGGNQKRYYISRDYELTYSEATVAT